MFRNLIPLIVASFAITIGSQAYGQGGFGEADANQDSKIDAKELKQYVSGKLEGFDKFEALFKALDADKDDAISEKEFENRMAAVRQVMGGQPDETKKTGDAKQRPSRQRPSALKVGDVAPTFELKSLDGNSETNLASFKGKKPVILIFGSYS